MQNDQAGQESLILVKIFDRGRLVFLNQKAITSHIGPKNDIELALEFVFCHYSPPEAEGLANQD
jgi:hypothetical protein